MNESTPHTAGYVSYEYKTLNASQDRLSLYLDSYAAFGWTRDPNLPPSPASGSCTLHLRRNRNILNKMELTRLQRNFEACISEIAALEKSKTANACGAAIAVGLAGTACMAGATFAAVAAPPIVWLCIVLAVPGLLGWIAPYFLYQKALAKRVAVVAPLIEKKYDEIALLCQKGTALL